MGPIDKNITDYIQQLSLYFNMYTKFSSIFPLYGLIYGKNFFMGFFLFVKCMFFQFKKVFTSTMYPLLVWMTKTKSAWFTFLANPCSFPELRGFLNLKMFLHRQCIRCWCEWRRQNRHLFWQLGSLQAQDRTRGQRDPELKEVSFIFDSK